MSLSDVKIKALRSLWKAGRPVKSRELARQLGLGVPVTNLHLVWLRRKGYIASPEKGLYTITKVGKEYLALPTTEPKQALQILSSVPRERAFHFYRDIDQYLGVYATNLGEFCDKVQLVDVQSIEFHLPRKDFESWFIGLGDFELAQRMSIIDKTGLPGEDLRKRIYEVVKSRCEELESLARTLGFV